MVGASVEVGVSVGAIGRAVAVTVGDGGNVAVAAGVGRLGGEV
jgi:hypothetical protein